MAGVVVRITRPNEAVVRHVVPFFSHDLARLAADAHRWIREEADLHIFPYIIVPALVRALCAFADHMRLARGSRRLGERARPRALRCAPRATLFGVQRVSGDGAENSTRGAYAPQKDCAFIVFPLARGRASFLRPWLRRLEVVQDAHPAGRLVARIY